MQDHHEIHWLNYKIHNMYHKLLPYLEYREHDETIGIMLAKQKDGSASFHFSKQIHSILKRNTIYLEAQPGDRVQKDILLSPSSFQPCPALHLPNVISFYQALTCHVGGKQDPHVVLLRKGDEVSHSMSLLFNKLFQMKPIECGFRIEIVFQMTNKMDHNLESCILSDEQEQNNLTVIHLEMENSIQQALQNIQSLQFECHLSKQL